MSAGLILEVEPSPSLPHDLFCKITIRDPSLGGRELQNMGGGVCDAEAITRLGPDRVEGTIFTRGEVDIGGHKILYALQFDAPVVNRSPAGKGVSR